MLFSLLYWGTTIYRKGTNVMEVFLPNVNLIAVGKIAKEKNIASRKFIKVSLEMRGYRER
jgi:hypothetical protein